MKILEKINSPEDLKKLKLEQLPKLASEIREFMIDSVSKTGGHIAPSLGTVELTIALHYIYNSPKDKIVWDVGHQAYAHKILTGRREKFGTLRQYKGISGFPHITESDYDALTVGHASTSISAAFGMAKARDLKGLDHDIVAVIGDGSISNGLAFEGLNNLGTSGTKMTVILNDNEMSISKNVGAVSKYLTNIITDKRFNRLKKDVWNLLGGFSSLGKRLRSTIHNFDEFAKKLVTPGRFFEDLGLEYVGPVDGHNLTELMRVIEYSKNEAKKPVLIHAVTKKGKGYRFAEDNATKFHGLGSFSVETGNLTGCKSSVASYSKIFGDSLRELARKDSDILAITAGMPDGTGLSGFRDEFPYKFFDVGIAEGHSTTFAAGLALGGTKPVVAVYSTFLQRAYDNIIHDVALDNLHVVFALDRAGIVGEDGPTHHGAFDLSYLRNVPNAVVMAPSNEIDFRNMLYSALYDLNCPVFIRYPRGTCKGLDVKSSFESIELYKPKYLKTGEKILFLSIGNTDEFASGAVEILEKKGFNPSHIDARFAKPLDLDFYNSLFEKYDYIVTLENNSVVNGYGTAVSDILEEFRVSSKCDTKLIKIAYPDKFIDQGSMADLYRDLGFTPKAIVAKLEDIME